MTNKYSVLTGLEKSVFKVIMFAGPAIIDILPQAWMNLTVGMVLAFIINYAKNKDIKEV